MEDDLPLEPQVSMVEEARLEGVLKDSSLVDDSRRPSVMLQVLQVSLIVAPVLQDSPRTDTDQGEVLLLHLGTLVSIEQPTYDILKVL